MSFCARGFEREVWGGNRGFVYIGLKLFWFEYRISYQQRPGGKFLEEDRKGIEHENEIIVAFPLWFFAPEVSRGRFGAEIVVLNLLAWNICGSIWRFFPWGYINYRRRNPLFCKLPATSGWKVFYFQHRRDRKVEHPALRWAPFLLAGVVLLANVGS